MIEISVGEMKEPLLLAYTKLFTPSAMLPRKYCILLLMGQRSQVVMQSV